MSPARDKVAGLLLAAGASRRLGEPKQLLRYRDGTLLDASLARAAACGFDQLLVAIGGAAPEVRDQTDFGRATVVENVHFTTGCSSSIVSALAAVDPEANALVLLLGDQPEVTTETVHALIEGCRGRPLGVCTYDDGRGHPFWFGREVFGDLADLQGDKAVWKLLESGRYPVTEIRRSGDVPLDVDTWDDYAALLEQADEPPMAG